MTDLQKALIELLDEIDGYCRDNDLHYFLAYEAALSAYRSHSFETYLSTITIFMPYDDIIKLDKIIKAENNPSRKLDSIVDNPNYPALTFRYSNEDTLFYNMRDVFCEQYDSRGIHVKISPLKKRRGGFAAKLLRLLELGFYSMNLHRKVGRINRTMLRACKLLMKVSNKLYRKLIIMLMLRVNHDATMSDTFAFDKVTGGVLRFPRHMFDDVMEVEFEGGKYFIPRDVEQYFSILYSFNWRNKKYGHQSIGESFIIDANLPYKYYFDYIEKNNLKADIKAQNERLGEIRKIMKKYNQPIDNAWLLVQRSAVRTKMMIKYLPLKEEINTLLENEDWDALDEILAEYQEVVAKFVANKLAVYFDKDIYNAYKQLAIRKGQEKLIEVFEKNVPEIHMDDPEMFMKEESLS